MKKNTKEKRHPDFVADAGIRSKNKGGAFLADENISVATIVPIPGEYVTEKKIIYAPNNITTVSEKQGDLKNRNKRKHKLNSSSRDDDKVHKDIKHLLLSAVAAFFLALLYGFFSVIEVHVMTNILFILAPFAIIGIWIFAMLLFTKYSNSDPVTGSTGQKQKKERIIKRRKAFILAGFLGIFGVHRFYLGYIKMGILEMLTLGGFFILYFIDLIHIKNGKLRPKKGNYDPEQMTRPKAKRSKLQNLSIKLIKLALLISLVALMIILGFAIFF